MGIKTTCPVFVPSNSENCLQITDWQAINMGCVGVTGFEPATAWSQTRSATGLRYAPKSAAKLHKSTGICKSFFIRYVFLTL